MNNTAPLDSMPIQSLSDEVIDRQCERELHKWLMRSVRAESCRQKIVQAFDAIEYVMHHGGLDSAPDDHLYAAQYELGSVLKDFQLKPEYYQEKIGKFQNPDNRTKAEVKAEIIAVWRGYGTPFVDNSTVKDLAIEMPPVSCDHDCGCSTNCESGVLP